MDAELFKPWHSECWLERGDLSVFVYSEESELDFGRRVIYCLELRDEKYIQVEFNQTVYRDATGAHVIGRSATV